jgi:CRISPR/Cas system-associated protein Csm6
MKIVITTVGTSLFENYMSSEAKTLFRENDENHTDISQALKNLRDKDASEYNAGATEVCDKIKPSIENLWLKGISKKKKDWIFTDNAEELNEYASAEIESILKIRKEEGDFIDVRLIATDTVLSRLAASMIATFLNNNYSEDLKAYFNPKIDVIQDLRIDDFERFKEGLIGLSDRFYNITNNKLRAKLSEDIILNVTGGYKGIIPYLSLLGQVNQTKVQYTFEDTGVLITIPQLPIKQDDELFEKHWKSLQHLLKSEILSRFEYSELYEDLSVCFDLDGNDFCFNFLGEALWKKFLANFFDFYCSDEVLEEIESNNDIYNEVASSFYHSEQRLNLSKRKPQPHNDHLCYGKSRHKPRIFYFEEDGNIFIYKVFIKHNNEYESYLDSLKKIRIEQTKKEFMYKSTIRKLKIKK